MSLHHCDRLICRTLAIATVKVVIQNSNNESLRKMALAESWARSLLKEWVSDGEWSQQLRLQYQKKLLRR